MSLIWNRVDTDNTNNKFFKFQNRSLMPEGKVHITISNTEPTSNVHHTIVSRQFLQLAIMSGEVVWFAEEDGGVFTHSSVDMPKLENYNIESKHEVITVSNTPVGIKVPEGATITFQNLSKSNIGVTIGSDNSGAFVLSQYQIFAESFPKEDIVTFKPDVNGTVGDISYSITQSAIITQLSPSTQHELDKLKASVDLVMEHAVTKDELEAVEALVYHGTWSKSNFIQRSNTKTVTSYPFIGNVQSYHSRGITDNIGFEIAFDLNMTYEDENGALTTDRGLLYAKGLYRPSGKSSLLVSECTNLNLARFIEQINVNVSANKMEVIVGITLSKTAVTSSLTSLIRFEHNYLEPYQGEISNVEFITAYEVDLINTGVDVSKNILNLHGDLIKRLNAKRESYTDIIVSIANESEEVSGVLYDVLAYQLSNGQYFKVLKDGSNKLRTRVRIHSDNLSNAYKTNCMMKSFNEVSLNTFINYSTPSKLFTESRDGNYKIIDTDIESTLANTNILNKLVDAKVGDTLIISFREEV